MLPLTFRQRYALYRQWHPPRRAFVLAVDPVTWFVSAAVIGLVLALVLAVLFPVSITWTP